MECLKNHTIVHQRGKILFLERDGIVSKFEIKPIEKDLTYRKDKRTTAYLLSLTNDEKGKKVYNLLKKSMKHKLEKKFRGSPKNTNSKYNWIRFKPQPATAPFFDLYVRI